MEDSPQATRTEQLQTKYAVAIAKVIGLTPYLIEFDQLCYKLKPQTSSQRKKAHNNMLKMLLTVKKITEETHSQI